jgi:site-specific DNA-methyltransferase (adenine-specific)
MIDLFNENCLEGMKRYPDNFFHSMVTDPPYGWAFMGKKWDYQVPSVELWQECLRVLKPGGHALVACGTRTQHRMATNLEDAGFEIRDIVAWIYGSGFPKSLNIGKAIDKLQGNEREVVGSKTCGYQVSISKSRLEQGYRPNLTNSTNEVVVDKGTSEWEGWGTALKPAMELWTLCRKPLSEKTVASNVLKYGTGGLNIDGGRISLNGDKPRIANIEESKTNTYGWAKGGIYKSGSMPSQGRFPANVILDEEAARLLDEQSGERKAGGKVKGDEPSNTGDNGIYSAWGRVENKPFNDSGGASRFFYTAKASKSERNRGCEELEEKQVNDGRKDQTSINCPQQRGITFRKNYHPTVKPLSLMQYLCKLITPPEGIVLEPFLGSGTTAIACYHEGFGCIGFEIEKDYFEIAVNRLEEHKKQGRLFDTNRRDYG